MSDNLPTLQPPKAFQGSFIRPGDPDYEAARKVWNGLFDKYPAAIARCTSAADVAIAVTYAQEQKLVLAVRGGGHDYAGHSVCDGGLVIDLSPMNKVQVMPDSRTAFVEGGATWGEFDAEAQKWGLATTGGTASSIGVGGLTLGGGTGYLVRSLGLALDNVLSAELVTAAGEQLMASPSENEDLFWAIRGGGGNYGIVTRFQYQLHPLGPEVLSAQFFHPYEDIRNVLEFYRSFMAGAPDVLQCYAFVLHVPPVAPFPEEQQGKAAIALIACYSGNDLKEGEKVLEPLQAYGNPFLAFTQPIAYTALQQAFDAGMPKGLRWYTKAHYLSELSDEVLDLLQEFTTPLPGAYTLVYAEPLGGAIRKIAPSATAFPHRDAAYSLHILPGWNQAADDQEMIRWAKHFHQAVAKHATGGVYVNLLSHDEPAGAKAAYGANYSRLAALKKKWDPQNVFSMNQNIRPEAKDVAAG